MSKIAKSNLHVIRKLIRVVNQKMMRSKVENSWRNETWLENYWAIIIIARNVNYSPLLFSLCATFTVPTCW